MKTKLLVVVFAACLAMFNIANAGEGDTAADLIAGGTLANHIGVTKIIGTYMPVGAIVAITAAALSDQGQACDDLPVKYIKQTGANYLTSVSGCEAKYPG